MFPKLTTLQWVLFILLLGFYGFAVFALTRDYYLRHPPQLSEAQSGRPSAAEQDRQLQERMRQAVGRAEPEPEINLESTDPIALGAVADQLFAAQRFEQAIEVYRRVLALKPDDAETYNDLGLALHYVGRSAEGAEALEQGTRLAPEFQRVWLSLGFVSLQTDQREAARRALARAQALDPESGVGAEARRLLGLIAESEGSAPSGATNEP